MGLIDELSLGTSVNLAGYRNGFAESTRMVDRFVDHAESKLKSIRMPALKAPAITMPAPRVAAPAVGSGLAMATGAGIASTLGAVGAIGAGAGIVGTLSQGIESAIELNETLSKTSTIFGAGADAIVAESDRMAAAFGSSRNEYINAATSFGAVFKGLGKSQADAAGLGNTLAKLGMDLASFDNTSNADAFGAISSALRGEFDPLERYRVFLSADKIAAEGLALGLAKTSKELTEAAKKQATLSLILKQTTDAQGDLTRTAGGTANQMRKLSGSASNFATSMGQAFLPAVDKGIGLLADLSGSIGSAFERNRSLIDGFVSGVVRGFDLTRAVAVRLAPSFLAIGSTVAGAFGLAGSSVSGFMPDLETFVGWAESGLGTVNAALQATIGFVQGIPGFISTAFGEGTLSALGGFASQAGVIGALVPAVASGVGLASAAFAGLTAALASPPVLIGAVGAGFLYLTGNAFTLSDAIGTVGFGLRNFSALGEIAFLKVGAMAENFVAGLGMIPENLGRIAMYAATNWLDLMMLPFDTLTDTITELGAAIVAFVKDPTQGFQFDFGKALRAPGDLMANLPELASARKVDVGPAVDAIYERIAKDEAAFARRLGDGFKAPPLALAAPAPAIGAPKPQALAGAPGMADDAAGKGNKLGAGGKGGGMGDSFAGAYQLGSVGAYNAILKGFATGPTGFDSGPDVKGSEFAKPPEMGGNEAARKAMGIGVEGDEVAKLTRQTTGDTRQMADTLRKILQAVERGNQATAAVTGAIKEIQRPTIVNI